MRQNFKIGSTYQSALLNHVLLFPLPLTGTHHTDIVLLGILLYFTENFTSFSFPENTARKVIIHFVLTGCFSEDGTRIRG